MPDLKQMRAKFIEAHYTPSGSAASIAQFLFHAPVDGGSIHCLASPDNHFLAHFCHHFSLLFEQVVEVVLKLGDG